jgi:hypothetical protein
VKKQVRKTELPEPIPISSEDYREKGAKSPRDVLLLGLRTGELSMRETIGDISEEEYHWEPIPKSERDADLLLPPDQKRVWRVFQTGGVWIYDYTPGEMTPPPFTTIAWIMNHVAQTGDMYLYCVKTGKPEGVDRRWEDLPVPSSFEAMGAYIFEVLADVRAYLASGSERQMTRELNRLTPAPWGEMRPTYLNIWGGVISHVIQHAMQIAARKDRIRYGY